MGGHDLTGRGSHQRCGLLTAVVSGGADGRGLRQQQHIQQQVDRDADNENQHTGVDHRGEQLDEQPLGDLVGPVRRRLPGHVQAQLEAGGIESGRDDQALLAFGHAPHSRNRDRQFDPFRHGRRVRHHVYRLGLWKLNVRRLPGGDGSGTWSASKS
jgi:hypothetical protein